MQRGDIKKLQQAEYLAETLQIALEQYEKYPQASCTRGNLAAVYADMCKVAAANADIDSFSQSFVSIVTLDVLKWDRRLSESMCWNFRAFYSCSD